jgi:hypothetical protein
MSISRAFYASLLGLGLLAGTAHADMARVGPVRASDGFPSWYQDQEGLILDPCLPNASDPGNLQASACLVFPGPPDPPFTFPNNYPDEMFYFRAVSQDVATSADKRARLVLALEGAFGSGVPAVGDQIVFTRIRVTAGVPFSGTYTVTHPYGVEVFPDVVAGQGNRDIVFSEDIGVNPGDFTGALRSRVGPFLRAADANGLELPPVTINGAQFLSDGANPTNLTGSPFNTNYFEICGPFDGPGNPDRCIREPLFTLTGRLHDNATNPIASPLTIDQATYARNAAGTQVDVSASALPGIGRATPRLSMGASGMSTVLMRGPDALGTYFGQGLPTTEVPSTVTVINDADPVPSTVTMNVVDRISVVSADYDASARSRRSRHVERQGRRHPSGADADPRQLPGCDRHCGRDPR